MLGLCLKKLVDGQLNLLRQLNEKHLKRQSVCEVRFDNIHPHLHIRRCRIRSPQSIMMQWSPTGRHSSRIRFLLFSRPY